MYILKPPAAGILYAPLFYTPPTLEGSFRGGGGESRAKNKNQSQKKAHEQYHAFSEQFEGTTE